jgi:hypothetical protein
MKMQLLIHSPSGGRRRRMTLALAAALATTLLCAAPALATATWHITMTHANAYGRLGGSEPYALSGKTFARESTGNMYKITVTNAGSGAIEPTTPVVVSDPLPAGMVAGGSSEGQAAAVSGGRDWSCELETKTETSPGGVQVEVRGGAFECTLIEPLNEPYPTLAPGESYPAIDAVVSVSANAAPPVTDAAIVRNQPTVSYAGEKATLDEGGAADPTAQQESETRITPAMPFGIASFAVHAGVFEEALFESGKAVESG